MALSNAQDCNSGSTETVGRAKILGRASRNGSTGVRDQVTVSITDWGMMGGNGLCPDGWGRGRARAGIMPFRRVGGRVLISVREGVG